jgi:translation initiation factor IF-1
VAKDVIELIGKVVETFPNATFQVKVVSPEAKGHEVLCHLAGRMRVHRVQILPGDNVRLEMTPYDLQKGRITYRFRPNQIINEDGTITEVAAAPHVHRRPPPRRR